MSLPKQRSKTARDLLLEKRFNPCLCNLLVDLRLCAAGRDAAQHVPVYLNRQTTLIGEELWKRKHFSVAFLERVRSILGRTPIKRSVARLLLGKLNRVQRGAICLFKKEQVTAFVHDADRDLNVEFFGFLF